MRDRYESPLSSRYASEYMLKLFSADSRYQTWRRLWAALAREESRLGLPITREQAEELANSRPTLQPRFRMNTGCLHLLI